MQRVGKFSSNICGTSFCTRLTSIKMSYNNRTLDYSLTEKKKIYIFIRVKCAWNRTSRIYPFFRNSWCRKKSNYEGIRMVVKRFYFQCIRALCVCFWIRIQEVDVYTKMIHTQENPENVSFILVYLFGNLHPLSDLPY